MKLIDQKLQELAIILNQSVTKQEILDSFKIITNLVAEIKKNNIESVNNLEQKYDEAIKKINAILTANLDEIKTDSDNFLNEKKDFIKSEIDKLWVEHQLKMQEIDDKLTEVRDGKDADSEEITAKVISSFHIPSIEEIGNELPRFGERIRDGLEILDGKERLNIEAIDGLKEALEEIKNIKQQKMGGGGGFSKIAFESHIITGELLGTGDGETTEFSLANTPNPENSVAIFVDLARMWLTDDFTFSGRKVTFLTAPPLGVKVRSDYRI